MKNDKNKILLLVLLLVLAFLVRKNSENISEFFNILIKSPDVRTKNTDLKTKYGMQTERRNVHKYIPYEKKVVITEDFFTCNEFPDGKTGIDYFNRDEFVKFRIGKVKEYAFLNVFPKDYHPLKDYHSRIYRRITFGKRWLGPTVFYIANPYNLIVLTKANHVTPIILECKYAKLTYEGRTVKQVYRGSAAKCWFDFINSYNEYEHLRLQMVNAYDAGFIFTHIDKSKSVNIEEGDYKPNIITSLFSQSSFYHVGKYGVNNISPMDRRGWFKVKRPYSYTKIFIKLWQKIPSSLENDGDINYIIEVIP